MKIISLVLVLALALAAFPGCGARTDSPPESASIPESSAAESSSSAQEPLREDIPAPPADLRIPGEITVYTFNDSTGIFSASEPLPSAAVPTLADIVAAVAGELDVSIPVREITQQKGMVVVDLAGGFAGAQDEAETRRILVSLGATLRENHRTFEWIRYNVDGDTGPFGERYELPPLKLVEGDPAEFDAIRAQISYEGLQPRLSPNTPVVETDPRAIPLTEFLSMLPLMDRDIASPNELDRNSVMKAVIWATKGYSADPTYQEDYMSALKPLVAPASEVTGIYETHFWLKEHIEQSAKRMFGEDYELEHGDAAHYRYIRDLGVYTPPHMGGGYNIIPVILASTPDGDLIHVEVAIILEGMGGFLDPDATDDSSWDTGIPEHQLLQYAVSTCRRREVVVRKMPDGHFVFVSHKYL